jgi:predicted Fe-S protein YdhL (DUF1289 family)
VAVKERLWLLKDLAHNPAMESPCINICLMDPDSGLCTGCGRSLDEIGQWYRFTSEERRRIMAELPERMEKLNQESGKATNF